jgi:hypothetical protein
MYQRHQALLRELLAGMAGNAHLIVLTNVSFRVLLAQASRISQ